MVRGESKIRRPESRGNCGRCEYLQLCVCGCRCACERVFARMPSAIRIAQMLDNTPANLCLDGGRVNQPRH